MTNHDLRTSLQQIATEVTVVDLGPRVRARAHVVRRRRRVAAIAAPVAAAVAAGALLSSPPEPDAAPPAGGNVPAVDLADVQSGGLVGAELAVVDAASEQAWLVTSTGRAARVPAPVSAPPGAVPQLSADGTALAFGGPDHATLVQTADGSVTELDVPTDQDQLPSVSPNGQTLAYAQDNQVDAIELTLVPLDGAAPTTHRVSTSAAAGQLVPVVWSDDGTGLLVLEGGGATRVDLGPQPQPRRGVFVQADAVLANGWAAAPDLSRFLMSEAAPDTGQLRTWFAIDSENGDITQALARPAGDRLIGWTADDRLVWWRRTDDAYLVLTTDPTGRSAQIELRMTSPLSDLRATWTGDEG